MMQSSSPTHPEPAARAEEIRAHAVALMYERLGGTQLHLFLMPAIMAYALWGHVNHAWLMAWVVLVCAVYGTRIALAQRYRRQRPGVEAASRWGRYFTLTSVLSGLAWGIGGMLFFVPDSVGHQVLLYTSIMGLAAGSMIVTAYWITSLYAFAVPAIGLSALRLGWEGTFEYQGLAVLMLMYLSIVILVGRNQEKSAYDTIRLRFENIDLVAQLRQQKEMAESANIAKSRFLAAASHDLRQPLHALGLFAAALNERISHPSVRATVVGINRSVAALDALFDALLDISKLDAGVIEPEVRNVSLTRLFARLDGEYAAQAQTKGLAWRVNATRAVVRTDPLLLERILRNLLSNAIRYTEQGEVRLECKLHDGQLRIEVSDTGIGIPPEHQQDVFREFVQLHNPERDRRKGIGLGLAIVQRLARLLGHTLDMHSQPGTGTVFRLTLPFADQADEDAGQTGEFAAVPAPSQRERVLVIDDEVDVREAMVTLLTSWGYEVVAVADDAEALAERDPRRPMAIIADYRLRAGRTGVEAIRAIQARFNSSIPALLVTGDTDPQRIREAKESGLTFLHKPLAPARLRAFLRAAQSPAG